MKINIHLYLILCEVEGGHTHTSISLLALSPSLPPYFFPVPYFHTSLHYLNRLILCKHAKCKRNLDANFMCYNT